MKALPAIFERGRIMFPFDFPAYEGPVSVIVVFPDTVDTWEMEMALEDDEDGLEEPVNTIPW